MKTKKIALLAPVILTAFLSTAYVSADETSSVSTPDVVLNQTPDQSTVAASVNSTDVSTVAVETSPVVETTSKVEVNTPNQVSVSNANPVSTPVKEVSAQQKPSEALSQTSAKTYQAARGGDDTKQESNAPVTADLVDNQLVVNYKPTIAPDEQVKFAVWSQINGQDDLVWYDSSATGAAYIDLSKHRSYGVYNVHTYAFKENTPPRGISALTVTLPEPKVETTISQETSNTYAVTVKNVPSSIDSIMVPVWSAKDGQDDIKWYQASQVNASTYSVIVPLSEHHFDMGHYDVHVYGHSKVTGGLVGLAVTGGFNHQDKRENAKIAVVDYAENKTQFDVVVSSNANTKPIKSVSIAVWSEAKGQDDLKWYTPSVTNNQARVTIDIANHSNTSDKYNVHVYTDYADGSRVGQILGAYQITKAVAKPVEEKEATVKVSRYDKDKGQLDVTVSQGDKEVKYVRVAAWSEDKQSNLHWYVTKDLQNGQATVTVDQTNHKGLSGSYVVHTYVDYADGSTKGFVVGQYELAKKEVKAVSSQTESASQGNYSIVNRVIYLDAGHGGKDPGASYFGENEKTLNLQMQELVKARLENAGYRVITTRVDDTFVDLIDRSKHVNSTNSDLFLSLHFNAGPSTSNGIETYYYEYDANYPSRINQKYHNNSERLSKSAALASAIQEGTVSVTGAKNNGVQRNTFAVLRETTAPAVLVELGYMSNKEEFSRIRTKSYQEKLANGIVSGINRYYSTL